MLKGEVECACTKGGIPEWEEERVLGRNETPEHVIRGPSVVDDLEKSGEWGWGVGVGRKGEGASTPKGSTSAQQCLSCV